MAAELKTQTSIWIQQQSPGWHCSMQCGSPDEWRELPGAGGKTRIMRVGGNYSAQFTDMSGQIMMVAGYSMDALEQYSRGKSVVDGRVSRHRAQRVDAIYEIVADEEDDEMLVGV